MCRCNLNDSRMFCYAGECRPEDFETIIRRDFTGFTGEGELVKGGRVMIEIRGTFSEDEWQELRRRLAGAGVPQFCAPQFCAPQCPDARTT